MKNIVKPKPTRTGPSGKSLPTGIRLRALRVSQRTLDRYFSCCAAFEEWVGRRHQRVTSNNIDSLATSYITYLHENEYELSMATYTIYGLQMLKCQTAKEDFLPCAKLALSGWKKQNPGNLRLPVPEEFLFDLGTHAIETNRLDIAMLLMLQFDCYLRPSEALNLTTDHIGFPASKRYPHWSVVIAPSALRQTTKTGKSDDSVLVGDKARNTWMRECMRLWMKKTQHWLFPNVDLAGYEKWCKQACSDLGYASACVMPHIVRHAGPSNDIYHKRRDLLEVQKRGRWEAKSSVKRYEKHGLLLQRWRQAATGRCTSINCRSQKFPTTLQTALRAQR